MFDDASIEETLRPTDGWTDTPEQARLRECLTAVLQGHNEPDTIRICYDIVTLIRDQFMTQTAQVRRKAAASARTHMSPADLAKASRQSPQTIARLLTESRTS